MELRIISCSGAVEHTFVSQERLVNQIVMGDEDKPERISMFER
jgi:hypothetical protein